MASSELAFDVPDEVIPDVPLAVPLTINVRVLLPGRMTQKGETGGSRDEG